MDGTPELTDDMIDLAALEAAIDDAIGDDENARALFEAMMLMHGQDVTIFVDPDDEP